MSETRRCERKHKPRLKRIFRLWTELKNKQKTNQTNLQKKLNYLEEYLTDILLAGIQTRK